MGNKQIMADNILYYMSLHEKTRNDLCRDLGFKYTTVTGWLTAEKYPRIDKIEKMANYFNISKADLVEQRKNTLCKETNQIEEKMLLSSLSKDEFNAIISVIRHGKDALYAMNLFVQLDTLDQGRIIGNMEQMLESNKYLNQESPDLA